METSTTVIISLGFLYLVFLALVYRLLSRLCRRDQATLPTASSSRQPGGGEQCSEAPTASSPRLCSYKNRRFLASIPNLDRLLCNTVGWQEGVTLESGLGDESCGNQTKANTTTVRQPARPAPHNDADNNNCNNKETTNKHQGTHKTENGGSNNNAPASDRPSASTQTSGARGTTTTSSSRTLAHSILNLVSAIPNISLGSFSQSQSLPNVHGCLAESVSTCAGSRDLVVLWSTTLESTYSGILTSTRVE